MVGNKTRQFRKSTIKEVAAQAGVSITTVSLFVSGRETVCSPETAQRIRSAISTLNYTPSSLTRGLRRQSSMTLGVCIPNPLDYGIAFGTPFFESLWRGVVHQTNEENYAALHYPVSVREGPNWAAFLDGRVDGLLIHEHENDRPAHLARAGMPVVMLARSIDIPDGCGSVWVDEFHVVDVALTHLWDLGHRRIAHVAGPVGYRAPNVMPPDTPAWVFRDDIAIGRVDGFISWMTERGIFDPRLVAFAQAWSAPQATDMVQQWLSLDDPPTAVFCANDRQAFDVIAALSAAGLRVPDDVSVVGVDNLAGSRDSIPPLTTVEIRIEEIGREAVRALLRIIQGESLEACRAAVPLGLLVERSSSGPARAA